MSEHYYTPKPASAHQTRQFEAELRGIKLRFATDAGVFSKERIDFGSRLLIETMVVPDRGQILDIGCGYGAVGLFAAAMAPLSRVTMVDINERAVELARNNAESNGLSNVEAMTGDLYSSVGDRIFDMIVTNPPVRAGKDVVHRIFREAKDYLNNHGMIWIVLQKKQGAPSALRKLQEWFPKVDTVAKDKGYFIFRAQKYE